jgi:hypothetical protein
MPATIGQPLMINIDGYVYPGFMCDDGGDDTNPNGPLIIYPIWDRKTGEVTWRCTDGMTEDASLSASGMWTPTVDYVAPQAPIGDGK